jgi:hypothetical protein
MDGPAPSGIEDWVTAGIGDGMYNEPDPNGRWLYNTQEFGRPARVDRKLHTRTLITPTRPPEKPFLRTNWIAPIRISPHDSRIVYFAAQVLQRSGRRSVRISPPTIRQRSALPVERSALHYPRMPRPRPPASLWQVSLAEGNTSGSGQSRSWMAAFCKSGPDLACVTEYTGISTTSRCTCNWNRSRRSFCSIGKSFWRAAEYGVPAGMAPFGIVASMSYVAFDDLIQVGPPTRCLP